MVYILGIISLGLTLVLAARISADCLKRLMARTFVKKLYVTAVMISLAVVVPELAIGLASVSLGVPIVILGTIVGTNILNLSLVIGSVALIGGGVPVVGDFIRWKMAAVGVAGLAPVLLLLDGDLSRTDGGILLLLYAIYVGRTIFVRRRQAKLTKGRAEPSWVGQLKYRPTEGWSGLLVKLVGSLVLLTVCSVGMVRLSTGFASEMGLPILMVSFILVAMGIGLPEVILEAELASRRQVALVLSDVLGLIVTSSTLVLGLIVMLAPIGEIFVPQVILMGVGFLAVLGLFWLFVSSKKKLGQAEGLALIGVYLVFIGLELLLD